MAQLIHKNGCLFSKIREAINAAEVKTLFDVAASGYWETHWRFGAGLSYHGSLNDDVRLPQCERLPQCDSPANPKPKHLGTATADILIINAVVPLLFCFGKLHKDESVCETAMRFLEETEAEDNVIIRHYNTCGIAAQNAMQTQALLHLYNIYCKRKRCLECRIGNVLIKP